MMMMMQLCGLSRDDRPPQSSSPTAVASAATAAPQGTKRWIPPSVGSKPTLFSVSLSERNDTVFRKVRGCVKLRITSGADLIYQLGV